MGNGWGTLAALGGALIFGLSPVIVLLVQSRIETRRLRSELQVPTKRSTPANPETSTLGEAIDEMRTDLFTLGVLFGSHIVHHEARGPRVTLNDLADPHSMFNRDRTEETEP